MTATTNAENNGIAGQSAEAFITAEGIHFAYSTKQILRGLDLKVRPGEVLGLLGPNGAGKSTLLSVLCGDQSATQGVATALGKPVGKHGRKELARVRAVMPQRSEFPFAYLARDIVTMGRACYDGTERAAEDEAVIDASLRATQVEHLAERDVTRLSGGEQARVTLARVLAQQTPIVFLDEPTAALDIAHQHRTMQTCRQLANKGVCVVAVMHDLQLAAAYCDRLALMKDGQIVRQGTCAHVLDGELLTQVYEWPIQVLTLPSGQIVVLPQPKTAGATT